MKRFLTNILIRNNRLGMMQGNGLDVSYEILNDDDYVTELKKKSCRRGWRTIGCKRYR